MKISMAEKPRHILFVLVVCLTAALVFSCSKVPAGDDPGDKVEFNDTYICDVRSAIREDGFLSGDAIGVMAYYVPSVVSWESYKAEAKPDFMYNQKVSYDGRSWSYAPVMYWPQDPGACVNFYAYFPWDVGTSQTGVKVSSKEVTGEPYFNFILNDAADVDLMVAEAEGMTAGSVGLPFRHVLGKLRFCFKVDRQTGFSYVVNKIKVLQTPKEAEYRWDDGTFTVLSTTPVEASAGVDGSGHLIDSTEPVLVDAFTMYLMPSSLGRIQVSVNNVPSAELDLSSVMLESGKQTTITMTINLSGIQYTTSVQPWTVVGSASGNIS